MTDLSNASVEQLEAALAAKKEKESGEHRAVQNLADFPEPKGITKTITKVNVSDLEIWLKNVFGVSVSLIAAEEWGNGEDHDFNIKFDDDMDEDEVKEIEAFLFNGAQFPMYSVGALLTYLVNSKYLAPANYLIEVYW